MASPTERYLQFLQAQQQQAAPFTQTMLTRFDQNRQERLQREQLDIQRAREEQMFARGLTQQLAQAVGQMDPADARPYFKALDQLTGFLDRDVTDLESARGFLADFDKWGVTMPRVLKDAVPAGQARAGTQPSEGARPMGAQGGAAQQFLTPSTPAQPAVMGTTQMGLPELLARAYQGVGEFGREQQTAQSMQGTYEGLLNTLASTQASPADRDVAERLLRRYDEMGLTPPGYEQLVTPEAITEVRSIVDPLVQQRRTAEGVELDLAVAQANEWFETAGFRADMRDIDVKSGRLGIEINEENLTSIRREMARDSTRWLYEQQREGLTRAEGIAQLFDQYGIIPESATDAEVQSLMDAYGVESRGALDDLGAERTRRRVSLEKLNERLATANVTLQEEDVSYAELRERRMKADTQLAELQVSGEQLAQMGDTLEFQDLVVNSGTRGANLIQQALDANEAGIQLNGVAGELQKIDPGTLQEMQDLANLTADATEAQLNDIIQTAAVNDVQGIGILADEFHTLEDFNNYYDSLSTTQQRLIDKLAPGVRSRLTHKEEIRSIAGEGAQKALATVDTLANSRPSEEDIPGRRSEIIRQLTEKAGYDEQEANAVADAIEDNWRFQAALDRAKLAQNSGESMAQARLAHNEAQSQILQKMENNGCEFRPKGVADLEQDPATANVGETPEDASMTCRQLRAQSDAISDSFLASFGFRAGPAGTDAVARPFEIQAETEQNTANAAAALAQAGETVDEGTLVTLTSVANNLRAQMPRAPTSAEILDRYRAGQANRDAVAARNQRPVFTVPPAPQPEGVPRAANQAQPQVPGRQLPWQGGGTQSVWEGILTPPRGRDE